MRRAAGRIGQGLAMYVLLVLALSAVFNTAMEGSLRAQVDEEVVQALRSARDLDPEAYEALRSETVRAKRAQYHLDESWASRVARRAAATLGFQFGNASSLKSSGGSRAVVDLVAGALPNTLILFGLEALAVTGIGTLVGLSAARRRGGFLDKAVTVLPPLLGGLPVWWLAMLALMAFSYALPIFPSGGMHANPAPGGLAGLADLAWHLALPLLLLAVNLWGFALQVRTIVRSAFDSPWVMAARARGIPERKVLLGHVLSSARPAILTLTVLGLLSSLSGNLLVEGIFGWPGIGNLYFAAVQQGDVPAIIGILSIQVFLNLVGLVALDLSYARLDPRLREGALA